MLDVVGCVSASLLLEGFITQCDFNCGHHVLSHYYYYFCILNPYQFN